MPMSKRICYANPHLYVQDIGKKGLAVFSFVNIARTSIVEVCPYIEINEAHLNDDSLLTDYTFEGQKKSTFSIPLGYAMLYNHSRKPNLYWVRNKKKSVLFFYAYKNIAAGDELTHNYAYTKAMQRGFPWYKKSK